MDMLGPDMHCEPGPKHVQLGKGAHLIAILQRGKNFVEHTGELRMIVGQ